jgi:hypothetical protein
MPLTIIVPWPIVPRPFPRIDPMFLTPLLTAYVLIPPRILLVPLVAAGLLTMGIAMIRHDQGDFQPDLCVCRLMIAGDAQRDEA